MNLTFGKTYKEMHCTDIFHGVGYYLGSDGNLYFLFKSKKKHRYVWNTKDGYVEIIGFRYEREQDKLYIQRADDDFFNDITLVSLHNSEWMDSADVEDKEVKFDDVNYGCIIKTLNSDRKLKVPTIYEKNEQDVYIPFANSIDLKWNQLLLTGYEERVMIFIDTNKLRFFYCLISCSSLFPWVDAHRAAKKIQT